ncbi:4Fe-4S binding protein [bacterium]|nr:4Fe-4S binding protein [bacterium]
MKTKKIQDIARKLLKEKKVDVVIGFEKGTLPSSATPCFIRNPDEVDRLIWNSFCGNNLANYLPKRKDKIGIVAKGCDSRSIVVLIQENQIKREQLYIIGIPCDGMTDKNNVLHDYCLICEHKNPVIYDVLVGEKVKENKAQRHPEGLRDTKWQKIEDFEKKSSSDKWKYLESELSKCIRCNACRNACPTCYCKECFIDQEKPRWVGTTNNLSDIIFFHLGRIFHQAGRCTDCGACVRACPMNIDLRQFTQKITKDGETLFDYETGLDIDVKPPFATFKEDDSEDFIK